LHSRSRNVLSEEHDVRLEQISPAGLAADEAKACDLLVGQLDIAIRVAGRDRLPIQIRIGGLQPFIENVSATTSAAFQAHDATERAV
jgi:hypothetical protein